MGAFVSSSPGARIEALWNVGGSDFLCVGSAGHVAEAEDAGSEPREPSCAASERRATIGALLSASAAIWVSRVAAIVPAEAGAALIR